MSEETTPSRDRQRHSVAAELRPYVDKPDIEAVDEVAALLEESRPIPRAGFRAELKGRLAELEATRGAPGWRPKRLRALIAAYAGTGTTLLGIAALGTAGVGPLG